MMVNFIYERLMYGHFRKKYDGCRSNILQSVHTLHSMLTSLPVLKLILTLNDGRTISVKRHISDSLNEGYDVYHLLDARNVQYDDFKSMIKDDKYSDKTKKYIVGKIRRKDL